MRRNEKETICETKKVGGIEVSYHINEDFSLGHQVGLAALSIAADIDGEREVRHSVSLNIFETAPKYPLSKVKVEKVGENQYAAIHYWENRTPPGATMIYPPYNPNVHKDYVEIERKLVKFDIGEDEAVMTVGGMRVRLHYQEALNHELGFGNGKTLKRYVRKADGLETIGEYKNKAILYDSERGSVATASIAGGEYFLLEREARIWGSETAPLSKENAIEYFKTVQDVKDGDMKSIAERAVRLKNTILGDFEMSWEFQDEKDVHVVEVYPSVAYPFGRLHVSSLVKGEDIPYYDGFHMVDLSKNIEEQVRNIVGVDMEEQTNARRFRTVLEALKILKERLRKAYMPVVMKKNVIIYPVNINAFTADETSALLNGNQITINEDPMGSITFGTKPKNGERRLSLSRSA